MKTRLRRDLIFTLENVLATIGVGWSLSARLPQSSVSRVRCFNNKKMKLSNMTPFILRLGKTTREYNGVSCLTSNEQMMEKYPNCKKIRKSFQSTKLNGVIIFI